MIGDERRRISNDRTSLVHVLDKRSVNLFSIEQEEDDDFEKDDDQDGANDERCTL